MGLADLHIHTIFSHDATGSIPAILKHVAENTNLDVIAITDHNTVRGNRLAMDLGPQYGIEVIPGCEISTRDGHLLALFIDRLIPPGLSLVDTVQRVGEIGGICVVPHPLARGTSSVTGETLHEALAHPGVRDVLVGIEAFNGGLVYTRSNCAALELARSLPLAWVGNSDSHILETIGEGSTSFPGRTALDLRCALESGATRMCEGLGLTGMRAFRHWVPRYMLRKLGWVSWNAGPQMPMKMVRIQRALAG